MDRNVREPDRAMAKLLERLTRDVQTLRSRTLVGATLFGYEDDVASPSPDQTELVSINVTPGRWTVDIEGSPYGNITDVGEIWVLEATASLLDGTDYSSIFDVRPQAVFRGGVSSIRPFVTLFSRGWLDADEPFVLSLMGSITNHPNPGLYYVNPLTWARNKITATPR